MFRADGNDRLECSVDASNKQDWKDGHVVFGYTVTLANGPVVVECGKLKNTGWGTPAVEFMALAESIDNPTRQDIKNPVLAKDKLNDARNVSQRWASSSVMWLRQMLKEIKLDYMLTEPTPIYSDSKGAIEWMKFRKITPGNNYILLAYHQVREWVESNQVTIVYKRSCFNTADILTKAVSRQVYMKLLLKFLGYNLNVPGDDADDPQALEEYMRTAGTVAQQLRNWTIKPKIK